MNPQPIRWRNEKTLGTGLENPELVRRVLDPEASRDLLMNLAESTMSELDMRRGFGRRSYQIDAAYIEDLVRAGDDLYPEE